MVARLLNQVCGRPVGTTVAAGYKVGPGHHKSTTIAAGYNASSGRPVGSTEPLGTYLVVECRAPLLL